MSKEQDKLNVQANSLRRQISEAEALLGDLKSRLAKVEAKLTGAPVPATGLDLIWKAALPRSRSRSSQYLCRVAWNRIPPKERPPIDQVVHALKCWNRTEDWKKDDNEYALGLHKFIQQRRWESLPEGSNYDPNARYRAVPTPPPAARTAEDTAALLEFLAKPVKRMPS